jgi:hypothetical protein
MRNTHILAIAMILAVFTLPVVALAQEPDSLKAKNEVKVKNQGEDQKPRIRTEEQMQTGRTDGTGLENKVSTRNESESDKIRVRAEEGDKAKGEAIQNRFRDENGDGIPDSTQAKKKERNRHRVRHQENKQDGSANGNMTPQGATTSSRKRQGEGQGSGSGRP